MIEKQTSKNTHRLLLSLSTASGVCSGNNTQCCAASSIAVKSNSLTSLKPLQPKHDKQLKPVGKTTSA